MPPWVRARLAFLVLALSTIALGLIINRRGTALLPSVRDVLGDALWAMMIAWWVGALAPRTRPAARALVALALCWAVEVGQLAPWPALDRWRSTTLGQLVLGSDFDTRDLVAYALGVLAALLLETAVRRRVRSSRAGQVAAHNFPTSRSI